MGKKYEPKNNFRLAEDLPYSGSKLDAEFGAVSDSTDKIEKWIRRSDFDETTGKLKAGVVAHHNVEPNLWQFLLDSARGESEQNRIDAQSAAVSADRSSGEAAKYARSAETAREGIEGSAARSEDAADAAELALQGAVEAQAESVSAAVDADNAENHARGAAAEAWLSEKQAADWAEYLAGPVPLADGSYLPNDAPESVQSGYFSSRWWAAEAERIVGEGGSWWLGNHAGNPIIEPPPQDGSIYWDLVTLSFWIYVDGEWHEVGRANATLSDAPPENPKVGDIWIDSGTTAEEFIWTGYEWISMTGGVRVGDNYDVPPDGGSVYGAVQDDAGLLAWTPVLTSNVETDPGQRSELESRSRVSVRSALTHQKPVNLYLQDEILDVDRRVTDLEGMPAPEADTSQIEADLAALEVRVESNESGVSVNAGGVARNESAIADEVAARIQGDIDLGIRIDGLSDQFYNDAELRQLIADEAVARENGDIQLAGEIQKEIADRVAGDAALGGRIDDEAAARAEGDAGLSAAIDKGDANLQLQIDALQPIEINERYPIFSVDEPTDYPSEPDPTPLEDGDEWYAVVDPDFDYNNPDPEGLDYYIYLRGDWVLQEPPKDYVERPEEAPNGKWLLYRETNDVGEWKVATTALIETNPDEVFRDAKGRFTSTPEELGEITNQLKANRFMWQKIQELDINKSGIYIGPRPPDDRANGMFWFDNSEEVMQLFIWHEDSDAWVPVAPPTTLEGRVSTGEATQAAIIAQIQESLVEQETIKNKVTALEGAVGEHSLVFNLAHTNPRAGDFVIKDDSNYPVHALSEASIIHISPEDRNGNSIAIDRITEGDVMRMSDIGGVTAELKIKSNLGGGAYGMEKLFGDLERLSEYPYDFNLFSSFDPAGLATKDYVDDRDHTKIGRNAIWTLGSGSPWELRQDNLSGSQKKFIKIHDGTMNLDHVDTPTSAMHAANKLYVDQEIAKALANMPTPTAVPQPAQFSWKYGGESSSAPGDEKFVKEGSWWKFALYTANDIYISWEDKKDWNVSGGGAFEMSIWRTDGTPNRWKMVKHVELDQCSWLGGNNTHRYVAFHQKWEHPKTKLGTGTEYFVTVGGFF